MSPASDAHVFAASQLQRQLVTAIPVTSSRSSWWRAHGGHLRGTGGASYVPDLCVLDRRALPRDAHVTGLEPAPLLLVEIVSPESRRRDLDEKADAYLAGGALAYWTVELPGLTKVARPEATLRVRRSGRWDARGPMVRSFEVVERLALKIKLDDLVLGDRGR